MALEPGERLGPYEIRSRIGAGGMGEVYRAFDTRLQRAVAIKVLPEGAATGVERARLEREAQAVAALSHPNVMSVFDVGTQGDVFYVVSELLEGSTLREALGAGAIPLPTAVDYARQAAAGLQSAHAKGIIHRDIKPENLFITAEGRLKILDFGLARLVEQSEQAATAVHQAKLTAPDTVLGTIGYMSPEQLRGEPIDHRTDIFSLGCVIFEMLGGRPPFLRASQTATVAAILNDSPEYSPMTFVPPSLLSVLQRCLAKQPADRYSSAAALAADLTLPSDARSLAATVSMQRVGRWRIHSAVAAAVAVMIVAAGAVFWMHRKAAVPATAPLPRRAMLAVLPFENLSGDAAQEYFSDGLTEDTTTEFGRLAPDRLGVIARTSSMRYKKSPTDVRTIGRELGVDYIVEGSVRRAGNRVRVAAQLVRATDGTQMWAETYDRTLDDVFAMQAELARDVAGAVEIKVMPGRGAHNPAAPLSEPGREAFLRGRYHLSLGTAPDRRKAVEYMQQAVSSDPQSAVAYTGLARAFLAQSTVDFAPRDIVPKARAAVDRAIQLDESVAEAHEVLGSMLLEYYWNWTDSERELQRAIALDPNLARAHSEYATLLVSSGRTAEGLAEGRKARVLDPVSALASRNDLYQLFGARRWNEAVEQAHKVIDLEPRNDIARAILALSYLGR